MEKACLQPVLFVFETNQICDLVLDRERNFLVREHAESYGSPYDYQSIIHYGGFAFSKNKKPTLIDKRSNKPVRAQRERLSKQDIVQINRKYRCGDLQQLENATSTGEILT